MSSDMLFVDFVDFWLDTVAPLRMKPTSVAEYRALILGHLVPAFRMQPLDSITAEEIQVYLHEKVLQGYSPRSARNHLAALRTLFTSAVRLGFAEKNSAANVQPPRHVRREQRFLSPEQMNEVLNHTPEAWKLLIALPMLTGCRKGEALALRWSSVFMEERRIAFVSSVRNGVESEVKTPASRGVSVPMAGALVPLFEERKLRAPDPLAGLVFCRPDGRHLADGTPNRVLNKACTSAGIASVPYHGLRHSSIAALIATGANAKLVQTFARHGSIDTTFDTYGHVFKSAAEVSVDDLNELITSHK